MTQARPNLSVLRFVVGPEPRVLDHLLTLEHALWDGTQAQDILLARDRGLLDFWTINGADGLVVTERRSVPRGLVLWVYGIAGSGIIAKAREVCDDLQTIAEEYGCFGIAGDALRPGLGRVYRDVLKAKRVCETFLLETDNGR